MAKPSRPAADLDQEPVVVVGAEMTEAQLMQHNEELIRVEAITDGTYPDFLDPRREQYYAIYRTGRIFDASTNRMAPGQVFFMKRKDALTAVHEKGNPFGWVRILADGELEAQSVLGEAPIPSTTAPRGYGQGRRPGLPQG